MLTGHKIIFLKSLAGFLCLMLPSCDERAGNDQIRDYIAAHPEEIVSSVLKYREKVRSQYQKAHNATLKKAVRELSSSNSVVINPAGRIDVIEILDYNCGYCKAAFAEIERRASREWKDVKFTLVPLPIISEKSQLAVLATREAVASDKNPYAFMQALLSKPTVDDAVTRRVATTYSIKLGDAERFAEPVTQDMKLMARLGIGATPTFIVGGEVLTGYRPNELAAAITRATREKAR